MFVKEHYKIGVSAQFLKIKENARANFQSQ